MAAKDENRWAEAIETVSAQDSTYNYETLGPLVVALFAGT